MHKNINLNFKNWLIFHYVTFTSNAKKNKNKKKDTRYAYGLTNKVFKMYL